LYALTTLYFFETTHRAFPKSDSDFRADAVAPSAFAIAHAREAPQNFALASISCSQPYRNLNRTPRIRSNFGNVALTKRFKPIICVMTLDAGPGQETIYVSWTKASVKRLWGDWLPTNVTTVLTTECG